MPTRSCLLRDEYPPFTRREPAQYPLTLEVEYDEDLSRWQIFLKWLFAIPHYLVLAVLWIGPPSSRSSSRSSRSCSPARYPRGLFDFVVGVRRWTVRVNAYAFWLMTDRYPPFSLK